MPYKSLQKSTQQKPTAGQRHAIRRDRDTKGVTPDGGRPGISDHGQYTWVNALMKRKRFEFKTQNPTLRALQKSGLRHEAKEETVQGQHVSGKKTERGREGRRMSVSQSSQ